MNFSKCVKENSKFTLKRHTASSYVKLNTVIMFLDIIRHPVLI
jgi:hypothetical protein